MPDNIIAQQIGEVIFTEVKKYPVPGPPYLDGSIGWGARPIDLGRAVLDSGLVVPAATPGLRTYEREIASLQKRLDARNDTIARVEALCESLVTSPQTSQLATVFDIRRALNGSDTDA
jgi:hypothetical protein